MTDVAGPRRLYYHGWNIVAIAILCGAAATGLAISCFPLFMRSWSAEFHAPISTLQLGLVTLGLFISLMSPLVGVMADKLPTRWLMIAGLIVIAIVQIGLSFASTLWHYFAFLSLIFPVGMILTTTIPANALISRWFVKSRGLALGLASFGLGAAGVILPPIVAAIEPDLGWRTIWRIGGAVVVLLILPLAFLIIRQRPSEKDGLDYLAGEAKEAASHHGGASSDTLKMSDVVKRSNFWFLVFSYLPMMALNGACVYNIAPIIESRGFSQQDAGLLLSITSLAQVIAMLTVGVLSDKIGNRLPLFGLGALAAVGGLCIAFGTALPLLSVGMALVALGTSFWPIMSAALAREFGAGAFGRSFGIANLFTPLTGIAPFGVAKLHELSGDYTPGIIVFVALALLGATGALFIREKPIATA